MFAKAAKFDMWQTTSGKFHRNFEKDPELFPQIEHKLAPENHIIKYIDEEQFPPNRTPKEMPASTFRTSNDLNLDHELAHYLNEVKHISDVRNGRIRTIAENIKYSRYLTSQESFMQTTTKSTHRMFTNDETQRNYPPDHATYWTCEEYPKGWGFGVVENPLPKIAPHARGIDMNRDPKINLSNGHVSKLTVEVPTNTHQKEKITNGAPSKGPAPAITPLYKEKYAKIPSLRRDDMYAVPNMYTTLNKTYGTQD